MNKKATPIGRGSTAVPGWRSRTNRKQRLHELMDGAATRAWAYTEAYTEKINSHTRASPNYLPAVWKAIKQIERSSSVHSYYFINQN